MFSEDLTFNGGIKSVIKNKCDNNQTVNYSKGSTIKDKIKNAEIEVDKVKNQITSLVQEDEYLQTQIVQTADNILAEVKEKYATNDSVNERFTQINQTASEIQISVSKTSGRIDDLENNGVDKVTNTTGTFDESGLSIGKSDSEFSSLLDNTGLFLKSRGDDIASYTKDGATLKNLTVENEMYLGYLRVMKATVNGEKRTHIHWIGG